MAAKALSMELLKQILRLKREGFPIKAIVRHTGISRPTVKKYLARSSDLEMDTSSSLPVNKELQILFNNDTTTLRGLRYEQLREHFVYAEKELSKTGVTRQLLWAEYKELHVDGYNYSQYCYHLAEYLRHKEVVMHLEHVAGEAIMIDFAGKQLSYVCADTGEVISCQVFISVLPHSGRMFCIALHSQRTPDFITAINAMLHYYGGVPQTILCDNLKTAVTRSDRYEPVFTEVCYQLSEHYNTCFSATRPYKPRDKAMVERCVNITYTHIYAPLRNRIFHSLKELNHHILLQLNALNDKAYKGSSLSRNQLFEQQEKSMLKSLPSQVFTVKKCVIATVQRNYHVQLTESRHYYSVPWQYAGKKVKVYYDNKTVEIYYENERVAAHICSTTLKSYHTLDEHRPPNHAAAIAVKGWTREDLLTKAASIGPHTARVADHILSAGIYPEQNYKSCHGMLMLQKSYGRQRLETACARVAGATRINYTMIKNILSAGLDKQPATDSNTPLPTHDNIRGADHYS